MEANDRRVLAWTQETTGYDALLPAPTGTPAESVSTVLDRYDRITEAFAAVFTPTAVTVRVRERPADATVPDSSPEKDTVDAIEVSDEGGVTGATIATALDEWRSTATGEPFLSSIESVATTAHVYLDRGSVDVHATSPEHWVREGSEAVDRRPAESPWHFHLRYETGRVVPDDADVDAVLSLWVDAHTDLYFDVYEDEISRINGARLHRALAAVLDSVPVLDVDSFGDDPRVSPTIAEELLTGEVGHPDFSFPHWPDADAMIAAYRAEWVADHCTPIGDETAEGDTLTWQCKCPDDLPVAELRERVAAAVDRRTSNGSSFDIDGLRVECGDLTIAADVDEDGLDWTDSS